MAVVAFGNWLAMFSNETYPTVEGQVVDGDD
jgi:hypothetical protein